MKSKSGENVVHHLIKGTFRVDLAASAVQDMRNLSVLVWENLDRPKKHFITLEKQDTNQLQT